VDAIEFYKKVFVAVEERRFTMPDDNTKIIHAVLRIGKNNNSGIMLADDFQECVIQAFLISVR
jgi:uncharacterized glyoxalase superfamily protein PhnB